MAHGTATARRSAGRRAPRASCAPQMRLLAGLLGAALVAAGCGGGEPAPPEARPAVPAGKSTARKSGDKSSPRTAENRSPRDADRDSPGAPPASGSTAPPERTAPVTPVKIYRPEDTRPRHDDAPLAALGIRKYASRHLLLYTDIEPEAAAPLPALMDRVYAAWVDYFGPLPPAADGSEFQMTGYLMRDQEPFREARLLPPQLPDFVHGRHLGAQFWMNDQETDYYRRHLMLHEGTHCFMTIVPHPMQYEFWYMEGMAECFGTHRVNDAGETAFAVMPHDRQAFPGLGRIRMLLDEQAEGRLLTVDGVRGLQPIDFTRNGAYAWSWGVCQFLNSHPRYRERFRRVSQSVRAADPRGDLEKLFADDWRDLCEEWLLFVANVCHGYDFERAAVAFRPGRSLAPGAAATATVQAARGWQSAEVRVERGRTYELTATGQFTLARQPKPWVSEPQGVSIRYCEGRPLGQLLGCIRSDDDAPLRQGRSTMREVIPLGRGARWTAADTGTLYLRVNDFWNELADNGGEVHVEVREIPAAAR